MGVQQCSLKYKEEVSGPSVGCALRRIAELGSAPVEGG